MVGKYQMHKNALRNKCRMGNFLQRAEWFECCQTSRNGNSTSDCSWEISASVQMDRYSKLAIVIVGFCSAI